VNKLFVLAAAVLMASLSNHEPCMAHEGPIAPWGGNVGLAWGASTLVPDFPMSPEQQINAELGLGMTITKVWCTGTGYHNPGTLVPLAIKAGIAPVVLMENNGIVPGAGQAANYKNGYMEATTCINQTGPHPVIFEAGNELDNWVGITGGGDGSAISQYNPGPYLDALGFIQGMIAAVRALAPSSLVAVDNAGWCHYGFLIGLKASGVTWDVTAEHWYGNEGDLISAGCENGVNILATLQSNFGKPIIVTENNVNANGFDKTDMASYFYSEMRELGPIATKYDLEGVIIHTLQDIPWYLLYGIINGNGSPSIAYPVIQEYIHDNPSVRYYVIGQ
jgi:hypothetical protein